MSKKPESPDAAKPARRGRLVPILVAVTVLAAGGAGGYWWWSRQHVVAAGNAAAHAPAPVAETPATPAPGSLLPLETFTVNLADAGSSRFLRANLHLVLAGEETAKELEHDQLAVMRARSAILELLTTQDSAVLITADGKAALKKAIAERVTTVLGHKVTDVLFSDFVVQF